MRFDDVVRIVRAHVELQFPKNCSSCGRLFPNLADYLRGTSHLGAPVSYDMVGTRDSWLPHAPLGTFSLANCRCGTTISISSEGMPLLTLWRLMWFARQETRRRGIAMEVLLLELRDTIDAQVLGARGASQGTQ